MLRRWMSRDPELDVAFVGQKSSEYTRSEWTYIFVTNSPSISVDPDGRKTWTCPAIKPKWMHKCCMAFPACRGGTGCKAQCEQEVDDEYGSAMAPHPNLAKWTAGMAACYSAYLRCVTTKCFKITY